MCAINPVHKKRFVIDCYTSDKRLTKEQFDHLCIGAILVSEHELNTQWPRLRFHVKESNQDAE